MTIIIERYYGNESQTPEMECSNDIIDKTCNGYALVSHTAIPVPSPGNTWTYFIHAVFRLDSDRSIGQSAGMKKLKRKPKQGETFHMWGMEYMIVRVNSLRTRLSVRSIDGRSGLFGISSYLARKQFHKTINS